MADWCASSTVEASSSVEVHSGRMACALAAASLKQAGRG